MTITSSDNTNASTSSNNNNNYYNGTSSPIYMETVCAPVNIAVIKYWGKANATYNTPTNDSLSVTLDVADLRAVTTVAASPSFTQHELWLNGKHIPNIESTNKRFMACINGVKAMARDRLVTPVNHSTFPSSRSSSSPHTVTAQEWRDMKIHVSSYNTFPTAAGLASSAAGYAALVAALAALMNAPSPGPNDKDDADHDDDDPEARLSTVARQGSGSSCRSLYGGFVAWRRGHVDAPPPCWDSKAEPVAPHTHWPALRALILVVSDHQKDTSSTTGMQTTVATSPLLLFRANHVVPTRMSEMETAIHQRDFATFAQLTMQDSNQFHATCLDTYPPIFYLTAVSQAIIRLIHAYNHYKGSVRAAYTFDAGPNAVLYVLEQDVVELGALLLHYYYPKNTNSDNIDAADDDANQKNVDHVDDDDDSFFLTQTCKDLIAPMKQCTLDPALIQACDATRGRGVGGSATSARRGEVQAMYLTRPGPGPQRVTTERLLDPHTGHNAYTPTATGS